MRVTMARLARRCAARQTFKRVVLVHMMHRRVVNGGDVCFSEVMPAVSLAGSLASEFRVST